MSAFFRSAPDFVHRACNNTGVYLRVREDLLQVGCAKYDVLLGKAVSEVKISIKLNNMGRYFDTLKRDIRMIEGLNSCMSCGVCSAVCPAAQYYDYDPRHIAMIVQNGNDDEIEELLKGDAIWCCGQCMSCRPRCPRVNTAGYIIQALRALSQQTGFFTHSEKGRQQLAIKRTIGHNILNIGYCIIPEAISPDMHLEQGEVWRWMHTNHNDFFPKFAPNYRREGAGALRAIDSDTMAEVKRIFEVTGAVDFYETIEQHSDKAAKELGFSGASEEYISYIYNG